MGTFLTTSILTKYSIEKSTFDSMEGDNHSQYKCIQKEFINTDADCFNISETDSSIVFDVKENILQKELIPFLETFYRDFHRADHSECQLILNSLKEKKEAKDWIQIAEQTEYQNFQMYPYGSVLIYHENHRISVSYNSITIAMEGKIMMESYGEHFSFFESLIKKCYADFQISNLILVNIAG